MSKLHDLIAQKEAIEREIAAAQAHSRAEAIAKIRDVMTENGLTMADLGGTQKRTQTTKVAAKYVDKVTGDSWSGRGLRPKWLKAAIEGGRKIEEFAVA